MYFLLSNAYLKYLAAVPSANLVDNGGDNYEENINTRAQQ